MRYERGDFALVLFDCLGDLQRSEHQPAGSMKDNIERHFPISHVNGADDLLRIVDIDVAKDREAQEIHGFLAMHQKDHPRAAVAFDF